MPPAPADRPHQMFATSLANGLRLLASFEMGEPALGNRDLAERTGLSKASVSRLTYTLCELGFLKYDAQARRYRLGSATLAAGYPLLASLSIRQVARPFMQALASEAGGSVSLGLRDRTHMVYVETCRGHEGMAFRPDIGGAMPVWATSIGRAWLAGAAADLREEVLHRIRTDHATAWKAQRGAVLAELEAFPRRGFCLGLGDWQRDVHAVGVPMRVPVDGETLVFNCGVPAVQLGPRTMEEVIGPRLVRMVREVEQAWLAGAGLS
ncbi:IclR family transcriptional regulator [Variovorax robiniae]|uniref:IclR family transcriptional regulator n=1 Tax=Variovorax robiniae TaxID=1836199 RepID=A0ABU8X5Y0_9BURK